MKNQLLALTLICVSLIFTDCKKKSDPQPSNQTQAAPTVASGTVLFEGSTRNLKIYTTSSSTSYTILGEEVVPLFMLSITFPNGKPTASKTITLNNASTDPIVSFQNVISEYKAISATIDITVIGSTVSVKITNATFKDRFSSNTVQASGTLVSLN